MAWQCLVEHAISDLKGQTTSGRDGGASYLFVIGGLVGDATAVMLVCIRLARPVCLSAQRIPKTAQEAAHIACIAVIGRRNVLVHLLDELWLLARL